MTANELESRTKAAESNPALIRPLIADFKAHKDAQLSDLTAQVNAAKADAAAQAEIDELKAKLASVLEAAENNPEDLAAKVAEARQTRAQKRLAEIAAEKERLDQEEAELKKPKETPQPSRRQ